MIFDDLAAILDLCEYLPYSKNDFARFSLTAYILSILQKNTTKVSVAIFSRSNSTLLLLQENPEQGKEYKKKKHQENLKPKKEYEKKKYQENPEPKREHEKKKYVENPQ